MKKELDIILKLTKKDEEESKEAVKSGNDDFVYTRFDCKNDNRIVNSIFCRGCKYAYKIDIRNPWLFGCYVQDYIKQVKEQIRI
jgi:hypothetical protein